MVKLGFIWSWSVLEALNQQFLSWCIFNFGSIEGLSFFLIEVVPNFESQGSLKVAQCLKLDRFVVNHYFLSKRVPNLGSRGSFGVGQF